MIKVFQRKNILMQSLGKNDIFIKEKLKIWIFSNINQYFDHIYKGNSLNLSVKYDKMVKFTLRMHKIYLKLKFNYKNGHFSSFLSFS